MLVPDMACAFLVHQMLPAICRWSSTSSSMPPPPPPHPLPGPCTEFCTRTANCTPSYSGDLQMIPVLMNVLQPPPAQELLHAICALSYSGDLRMGLAEDSRKVHRIVEGEDS